MSDKQLAIGIISLLLRIILCEKPDVKTLVLGCILVLRLSGSSPSLALSELRTKPKERMVKILAKKLDIIEDQIELGQVKTITSKGGTFVDFVELLFSPTTKAQFAPHDNLREIVFSVMDNNLDLPQLQCNMDKETLRNLIIALKSIYNQLKDESEDAK